MKTTSLQRGMDKSRVKGWKSGAGYVSSANKVAGLP